VKAIIAAIALTTAVLVAASTLGVAAAEAPTGTSSQPTVSVEGVGSAPIAQEAAQAAADGAYHQAMAAAETDAHSKAELLAGGAGATLGAVQSVVEGGGSIECGKSTPEAGEYPYEGAQPDFGYGARTVESGFAAAAAPEAASVPRTTSTKPRKKKKKKKAKAAAGLTCTLSAHVSLIYALS
jgi:uncharacterized protein YggE